jgi:hypothetical protein
LDLNTIISEQYEPHLHAESVRRISPFDVYRETEKENTIQKLSRDQFLELKKGVTTPLTFAPSKAVISASFIQSLLRRLKLRRLKQVWIPLADSYDLHSNPIFSHSMRLHLPLIR